MSIVVAVPKVKSLQSGTEGRARLEAIAKVTEFTIPALKIGTYDQLVKLSDDLEKVQSTVEGVTARLHKQIMDSRIKMGKLVSEPVMITGSGAPARLQDFSRAFQWADDKYPMQAPLREMVDEIQGRVTKYADTLQGKIQAYTKLIGELSGISNRATGNLLNCDLVPPIVSEENFIGMKGSEYCSSIFCVINKGEARNFESKIASCSPCILYPQDQRGQIRCLKQDETFCLYVVWVLNDSLLPEDVAGRPGQMGATPKSDFIKVLRENRWQFRDHIEWDPEAALEARRKMNELEAEKKQEESRLAKWTDAVFSEAYINYAHLKAINVFTEAVLRYGLGSDGQPQYIAYCIEPHNAKKLGTVRSILGALYSDGSEKDGDDAGMMDGRREYFPYVSETISHFADE